MIWDTDIKYQIQHKHFFIYERFVISCPVRVVQVAVKAGCIVYRQMAATYQAWIGPNADHLGLGARRASIC